MTFEEYMERVPIGARAVFVVNTDGSNGLTHLGRFCDVCGKVLVHGSHYTLPMIAAWGDVRHDGCSEWLWEEEWRTRYAPTSWDRILRDGLP